MTPQAGSLGTIILAIGYGIACIMVGRAAWQTRKQVQELDREIKRRKAEQDHRFGVHD